jgi:FlgD Ig-like domain
VIFRLPDGTGAIADGTGGGPAIGYTDSGSGFQGWMSSDGIEWEPLHSRYGFAVLPVMVPTTPDMTVKSNSGPADTEWGATEEAMIVSFPTVLHPASPNPFNPKTALTYSVKQTEHVGLSIYNLRGALVGQLVSGLREPGEYTIMWDGRDRSGAALSSGVYFARFTAGDVVMTQRLVLVR